MRYNPNCYTNPDTVRQILYGSNDRYCLRSTVVRNVTDGRPGHTLRLALAALDLSRGETVLEVGAGNGYFSNLMTGVGALVIASDISEYQLRSARSRYPELTFCMLDAARVPFRNAIFDAVVANFMLYHFDDPKSVLTSLVETLTPRGRVLVTTKAATSFSAIDRWHSEAAAAIGADVVHQKDELRVTEQTIGDILPTGFSISVKTSNTYGVQFDPETLRRYLDSSPFTHYDILVEKREAYHEAVKRFAARDNYIARREEWIFLMRRQ